MGQTSSSRAADALVLCHYGLPLSNHWHSAPMPFTSGMGVRRMRSMEPIASSKKVLEVDVERDLGDD